MPTYHNITITDAYGGAIESGQTIDPAIYPEATGQHVYGPGDVMPNYTLHPPTGLHINWHPTAGAPQTVGADTQLSSLLQENQGRVFWAACMEHAGRPFGKKYRLSPGATGFSGYPGHNNPGHSYQQPPAPTP